MHDNAVMLYRGVFAEVNIYDCLMTSTELSSEMWHRKTDAKM